MRASTPPPSSDIGGWPDLPRLPGSTKPDPLPLESLERVRVLRDMAHTCSQAFQVHLDAAIAAVLGGVSVAIVGKAKVVICRRRDWVKPCHTYVGIEMHSGLGKSPIINAILATPSAWEAKRAEKEGPRRSWNAEQLQQAWENLKTIRRNTAAAAKKGARKPTEDERKAAVKEVAEAKARPTGPFQFLIQDATEEEVVRIFGNNRGRAASIDPEGTILEVAAGRYGNGDARLAALTHGWDGEPMRVNRVTREMVDVPAANLAVLLGFQPGILAGMLNAETMRQRGVLGRFLFVAPQVHWDEILTGADVPDLDLGALARYGRVLERILDFPDKSDGFHLLEMSTGAQEWVTRLEELRIEGLRPGGPLQGVPSFGGKLPDHGARIGALLTVADRADRNEDLFREPIPGWAMEAAYSLIAAISTHVVRVMDQRGVNPRTADLAYLLDLCVEMEGSTQSEIRERARARQQFREADYAGELFDDLEKRVCIRRVARPRGPGAGNNPSPRIEVHPLIIESTQSSEESDLIHRVAQDRDRSEISEARLASPRESQLARNRRQGEHRGEERASLDEGTGEPRVSESAKGLVETVSRRPSSMPPVKSPEFDLLAAELSKEATAEEAAERPGIDL